MGAFLCLPLSMVRLATAFGIAGFVFSWLQPMHLLPWVGWHSEFLAFFGVFIVFAGASAPLVTSEKLVAVPRAAVLLASVIPLVVAQCVLGMVQFAGDALVISLYAGGSFLAILTGYIWAQDKQASAQSTRGTLAPLDWLALSTFAAAVASVLLALAQAFDVGNSFSWINRTGSFRRPGANFGQPNHLSTLLLLGAASALFLFHAQRISRQLCLFGLALLAVGMAITESRTGIVGAIALTVWWLAHPASPVTRQRAFGVILIWAALIFSVVTWPRWINDFYSIGTNSGPTAYINLAAGSRLQVWPQLLEAVLQKPWLGWGLREVSQAHNAVLDHYILSEPFTYAHNIVLEAFIGLGFPLTILVFGLIGMWGLARLKSAKTATTWYCVAFLCPLAVHSLFEYPLAYAYFLFPAMVIIGVLEGESAMRQPLRWPRWSLVLGFVATVSVALCVVVEYATAEEDFRVARFEAIRLGATQSDYQRPSLVLLTQLDAMLNASRTVPATGMPSESIRTLKSAALRFPWTAIQNRYALALALNGQPDEATRQLKVMRAMHGDRAYTAIKAAWQELAITKHPQLLQFELP